MSIKKIIVYKTFIIIRFYRRSMVSTEYDTETIWKSIFVKHPVDGCHLVSSQFSEISYIFFFNFSQCTKIYKDCVAKMADPKDRKGRMACGKLYLECAFKPEEMKCAKKVIYVEYFTLRNFWEFSTFKALFLYIHFQRYLEFHKVNVTWKNINLFLKFLFFFFFFFFFC